MLFFSASGLWKLNVSHTADKSGEWRPSGSWRCVWPKLYSDSLHYSYGCEWRTGVLPRSSGCHQERKYSLRELCGHAERYWPGLPTNAEHKVGAVRLWLLSSMFVPPSPRFGHIMLHRLLGMHIWDTHTVLRHTQLTHQLWCVSEGCVKEASWSLIAHDHLSVLFNYKWDQVHLFQSQ